MKRRKTTMILSAFIFILLLADARSNYMLKNLDKSLLDFTAALWADSTNKLILHITDLSGGIAVIIFSMTILIITAILKKWDLLSFSAMSVIGSVFFSFVFKSIVGRVRPSTKMFDPGEFAFPSGHAAISMCMCLVLYFLVKSFFTRRQAVLLLPVLLLFPMLISFSRVYLHVHYPSDVIGGMALSVAWVLLMSYIYLPNELSKTKQV